LESYIKQNQDLTPESYIFSSKKGVNSPITRQQAYRIINSAAETLQIVQRDENGTIISGEIGTHTLRKTFGYHAFNNGTHWNY